MKKIMIIVFALSLLLLVGCENKEKEVETQKIENVETKKEPTNQLAKELKIERTNMMDGSKELVTFDINYAKEYIRVLNSFDTDVHCYTYMLENSVYPLLVCKEYNKIYAYEFKDGKAVDVTNENLVDEFIETDAVLASYAIDALKETINDYNSIMSEYKSIGNRTFETFMNNRYSNHKELGSFSFKYDSIEAGSNVSGEEKGFGYLEDGKYKIIYQDTEKNRKTIITINGIDDEIVYVRFSSNLDGSGIPGMVNILTMNGDVYIANIVEVLPDYDEVNVDTEEVVEAVKVDSIKEAVSFIYTYSYPYFLGMGDGLDSSLFALTYDGTLYKLDTWTEI